MLTVRPVVARTASDTSSILRSSRVAPAHAQPWPVVMAASMATRIQGTYNITRLPWRCGRHDPPFADALVYKKLSMPI